MHPFCCVSAISDQASPVKPSSTHFSDFAVPPLPTAAIRSVSIPRHMNNHNHNHIRNQSHSSNHSISNSEHGRVSQREQPVVVDVKINDLVGNGISGILYKWVNYGKGWRPRWFVLQDGVLSYFKIHGPDKITVNHETEKGSKVIGDESMRRIARNRNSYPYQHRRKPFGEIHLKVSTIRESKSDDKRFSVFTGTKRLHLRAETREDRVAWMEALQAVKDMFPRMSNSELMAPVDNVTISTEKLRLRLVQEGVSEAAIQDSEQIMRSEFAALQNHLVLLKQKQSILVDTLRQLETEKVDLENTVVDESQRQWNDQEAYCAFYNSLFHFPIFNSEGSASESEDDNERNDAAEEETDDDDNAFFDTRDFLSSSSFKSNGSDYRVSSLSSDNDGLCAFESEEDVDPSIRYVGANYPLVKRRKKLPDPAEKEKGVSLWSMIKDNIGKDLTKVCLPVYFNEPLSSLQKCFEEMEYSYLLDQAYEWGRRGNSLMRILYVAAFAVSGYASTEGRICKPFNPLLGETYEANNPDKGLRFFSEKVSHHPMIVACHCEGTGWKFWGDSNLKSKFWGRSIQLDPIGILTLEFDDGEVFQWSKVTTSIYNLILGKLYCDHYGTMRIQGNREYSCKLKFKEQSIIDRNPHQVHGIIQDRNGKTASTLFGKWDESMHYVNGDYTGKGKSQESLSEAHLLWKRSKPPKFPTRYNFTRFAITLNELTPGLKEKLPPTDSRLRPDQRYLENGEYEMANSEKLRLEQRQRQARKMQERGWKPRWFAKDKGSETYRYIGGYWEAQEQGKWDSCPDIFGQIPSDHLSDEGQVTF
ncbi:oxysterol-binding protein-related protein 1A-like isoform X3 [Gastrolobium bilobum]|uniref:oxysterol-binding protein-related protein 1A-like isoform X3 n=1 Tax=Gastrolobium bilobum TaxID=150636 RepID=UPI002AB0C985|nr:oxysterol-binding protein-related protein 1A-like isoform X3 [Gastrolobium bilobum]